MYKHNLDYILTLSKILDTMPSEIPHHARYGHRKRPREGYRVTPSLCSDLNNASRTGSTVLRIGTRRPVTTPPICSMGITYQLVRIDPAGLLMMWSCCWVSRIGPVCNDRRLSFVNMSQYHKIKNRNL